MAPQEVTEDADVWFFLALDGDQAKALQTNPEVNISIAEAGNWLSVAGRVQFVDDKAKVDELWSDSATAWFDDRRDPNLGLIKVVTHSAQHWGLPGGQGIGPVPHGQVQDHRRPPVRRHTDHGTLSRERTGGSARLLCCPCRAPHLTASRLGEA
jgi:hypothetical protein